MKNYKLVFFDFETTGLSPEKDEIIQFMFLNSQRQNYYSSFVNPKKNIPPKISEITGITNEDVNHYPSMDVLLPRIVSYIGEEDDVYLVAHNGDSFDKKFLLHLLNKYKIPIPTTWKFIDTLKLARHFLPQLQNHKMDTLRSFYNISTKNAHLASKDVLDLEKIYFHMIGEKNVNDLYSICQNMSNKMPFGKYKGQYIKNIPLSYFQFLIDNEIISTTKHSEIYNKLKENVMKMV